MGQGFPVVESSIVGGAPAPDRRRRQRAGWLWSVVGVAGLFALWWLVATLRTFPEFILPHPVAVLEAFDVALRDGTLARHTLATARAMLTGLVIGVAAGVALGTVVAKTPRLERILSPLIVALQATPAVAYAPLLVIWFGSGITSKVMITALIVFFPMFLNTVVGIQQVPENLRELMRSLRASRWQTFTRLELPSAMPVLLTGLKTSATLAIIGAVVGEFISAQEGLGFLVTLARNQYNTALVFVAILTITALALTLYTLVSILQAFALAWQHRSRAA
jgi:NitT/TauT family transport system permease protein